MGEEKPKHKIDWNIVTIWIGYGLIGFFVFLWFRFTWFPDREFNFFLWVARIFYWLIICVQYSKSKEKEKEIENRIRDLQSLLNEWQNKCWEVSREKDKQINELEVKLSKVDFYKEYKVKENEVEELNKKIEELDKEIKKIKPKREIEELDKEIDRLNKEIDDWTRDWASEREEVDRLKEILIKYKIPYAN